MLYSRSLSVIYFIYSSYVLVSKPKTETSRDGVLEPVCSSWFQIQFLPSRSDLLSDMECIPLCRGKNIYFGASSDTNGDSQITWLLCASVFSTIGQGDAGIPWQSSGGDTALSLPRPQFRSLVGELAIPCGLKKKDNKTSQDVKMTIYLWNKQHEAWSFLSDSDVVLIKG